MPKALTSALIDIMMYICDDCWVEVILLNKHLFHGRCKSLHILVLSGTEGGL